MWKTLALAVGAVLTPLAALTQTGGAICRDGQGCICLDMDTGLLPVLLGAEGLGDMTLPDTIVVDRSANATIRTPRSRDEVHRAYGGQGDCPVDQAPDLIVPLDGTWQWRSLNETVTGCPAMLAGALAATRVETMVTQVDWDGRFDPALLASSLPAPQSASMSPYQWREIGPNRWLSDNIDERSCSDGTCANIALSLAMTLVAPDRISGLLTLRNRIEGPQAAILADFGMADCQVRVRYRIDRIAP